MALELADLLTIGIEKHASDLHLVVGVPPVLRIHGSIIEMDYAPLTPADLENLTIKHLTEDQRAVLDKEWQICHSLKSPELGFFRISVYHEQGDLGAAIRIGMADVHGLAELGLPPVVAELTRKPSGLILVTGPTGSGKSTTLNSMVDLINRERACKVITVEDPIEYVHSNKRSIVVQQEVHMDTHSFHQALIGMLRQDPDVIVVGEMRDLETIATALTAAETGHLVISTLHTPDAPQTIDRVIDVFPSSQQNQIRMQLAGSLEAVISQQLLPRADEAGRVLACEVMMATTGVRNIIRESKTQMLDNVISTSQAQKMQSLDTCLEDLLCRGVISRDTAVARAKAPASFHAGGNVVYVKNGTTGR
jgi:twitching motility protein PilT